MINLKVGNSVNSVEAEKSGSKDISLNSVSDGDLASLKVPDAAEGERRNVEKEAVTVVQQEPTENDGTHEVQQK